jgi:hypothetical protein
LWSARCPLIILSRGMVHGRVNRLDGKEEGAID